MTTVSAQLIDRLLAAWSLPGSPVVRQLDASTNNLTYLVEARGTPRILRVYPPVTNLKSITYEHDLLVRLHRSGLSFAVPHPLPDPDGRMLIQREWEGSEFSAALFPLIAGSHAVATRNELRACAAALSELGMAPESMVLNRARILLRRVDTIEL